MTLFVRPRIRSLPWVTSTTCCIGKQPIREWGNSSRCSRGAGYRRMRAGWTLDRPDFNSLPQFDRPFQEIDGMCSFPTNDCCFTNNRFDSFFFIYPENVPSNRMQRKNEEGTKLPHTQGNVSRLHDRCRDSRKSVSFSRRWCLNRVTRNVT